MNCLVYSLTRRIFHKSKLIADNDSRRTPSGGGKDSISAVAIEMSPLGSQKSAGYLELFSSVGSKDDIAAVGRRGDRISNSDHEGVTMERTWEVRTEEVKLDAEVSKVDGLGYHTYVSHLEEADLPGTAAGLT